MILLDVNVLVDAFRSDQPRHRPVRVWFEQMVYGDAAFGVPELALSGCLRMVTHPRVFNEPEDVEDALAFAERLRELPHVIAIRPGDRHWSIFVRLCRITRPSGTTFPMPTWRPWRSSRVASLPPPTAASPAFRIYAGATPRCQVTTRKRGKGRNLQPFGVDDPHFALDHIEQQPGLDPKTPVAAHVGKRPTFAEREGQEPGLVRAPGVYGLGPLATSS